MAGHVLITGGSAGIGAALALELARRGRAVGLVARRAEALAQVADQVRALGGTAAWAVADVADEAAMARAVAELEAALGPCEVLVANAGVLLHQGAAELDGDATVALLRTNVEGPIVSAAAVLPGMLTRGRGHLVLISSLAAFRAASFWAAYCASKSAATAWWEAARAELEPRGLQVSVVYPGYIETEMVRNNRFAMVGLQSPQALAEQLAGLLERPRPALYSPWALSLPARLGWWLPAWLVDPVLQRMFR